MTKISTTDIARIAYDFTGATLVHPKYIPHLMDDLYIMAHHLGGDIGFLHSAHNAAKLVIENTTPEHVMHVKAIKLRDMTSLIIEATNGKLEGPKPPFRSEDFLEMKSLSYLIQ